MTANENKYLEYFIDLISFQGKLSIHDLQRLAEQKGIGAEYYFCSYDSEDEDYQVGKVTLIFWRPALDEDVLLHLDRNLFYEYLLTICQKHISKYPHDKSAIDLCLKQISNDLQIWEH